MGAAGHPHGTRWRKLFAGNRISGVTRRINIDMVLVIFHLTMVTPSIKGLNGGNSGLMWTVAIHVAWVLRLRT